jgi:hypothetical protein
MAFGDLLVDGFDGDDFSPSGGLYYKDGLEQSAGRIAFQKDVSLDGRGALRLSVTPLESAPDLLRPSDRAEVWERPELRVPYRMGIWYGFAVMFAKPIPQDDHRYLIAQWKREIDHGHPLDFSPFLAIRLSRGKLFATVETNFHRPPDPGRYIAGTPPRDLVPVKLRPETNQMRALVAKPAGWTDADARSFRARTDRIKVIERGNPMPDPAEGWIDFVVYAKPGPDGSGHIEIFANGKWIVTVLGQIGHNDDGLGENQYFKFGPYRASGPACEWTLYFDDFRRSPRCNEVLRGADCPF